MPGDTFNVSDRGHTRANAGGLDLNRCYGDANPREHEGLAAAPSQFCILARLFLSVQRCLLGA